MQLRGDTLIAFQLPQKCDQENCRKRSNDEGTHDILPGLFAPGAEDVVLTAGDHDYRGVAGYPPQAGPHRAQFALIDAHVRRRCTAELTQRRQPWRDATHDATALALDERGPVLAQQLDGAARAQIQCLVEASNETNVHRRPHDAVERAARQPAAQHESRLSGNPTYKRLADEQAALRFIALHDVVGTVAEIRSSAAARCRAEQHVAARIKQE